MANQFDLVVRNGTVVASSGRRVADVAVAGGRFVEIAPPGRIGGRGRAEIDATALFVLPGLIDGHVHFREPGLEHKEDWLTGSRAAVMGGVTTVLDMPNTVPPTATVGEATRKLDLAGQKSMCDFGLFGLVGPDNIDHLEPLADGRRVVGFKVFLGETTGAIGAPTAHDLARAMSIIARLGFRLAAHCEDRAMVGAATERVRASGASDARAHLESRPAVAEVAAIRTLGQLARNTRCPVSVLHLSSAEGLAAVITERAAGADMTCEVSAHHSFLSADDATSLGGIAKCNPPIRAAADGAALLQALAEGTVDAIASDHAPHAADEKAGDDIWQIAPGVGGVETTLRLFLTHGVGAGRLTIEQLVRAFAERPAQIWGLWPRKGRIAVGADADLVIVDPERAGVIRRSELHSRHRLTPFEGWPTRGEAVATVVRGRIVMRDGEPVGEPGWGRAVERGRMGA